MEGIWQRDHVLNMISSKHVYNEGLLRSDYVPQDRLDLLYSEDPASAPCNPNSFTELIQNHPDMTNFVPLENVTVPILTFDGEGVNIDALFVFLNSASVFASLDIDNDYILSKVSMVQPLQI
eukprot:3035214-Ditylum_brightwellii.AAC.2